MEILKFENISFSYAGGVKVFDNCNFALKEGEKVGLTGVNGAGKSTFFQIACGLIAPSAGSVSLWGKECREEKDFVLARKKIGYLFQDPDDQIFCPTVEEDIAFGPVNLNVCVKDAAKITDGVMQALGIENLRTRNPFKLSLGQKRLTSLAGVLAMRPELLLLDEPTANIEISAVEKIDAAISSFPHSAIIASHDAAFLKKTCSKLFAVADGAIQAV